MPRAPATAPAASARPPAAGCSSPSAPFYSSAARLPWLSFCTADIQIVTHLWKSLTQRFSASWGEERSLLQRLISVIQRLLQNCAVLSSFSRFYLQWKQAGGEDKVLSQATLLRSNFWWPARKPYGIYGYRHTTHHPLCQGCLLEFASKRSSWVMCHVIKFMVSYLPEWCDSLPASGPHSAAGPRQNPAGSPLRRVPVGSTLAPSGGSAAAGRTAPPLWPVADMKVQKQVRKPWGVVHTHTYPFPVLAPSLALLLLLQLVHLSFQLDAPFPRQLHLPPHFLELLMTILGYRHVNKWVLLNASGNRLSWNWKRAQSASMNTNSQRGRKSDILNYQARRLSYRFWDVSQCPASAERPAGPDQVWQHPVQVAPLRGTIWFGTCHVRGSDQLTGEVLLLRGGHPAVLVIQLLAALVLYGLAAGWFFWDLRLCIFSGLLWFCCSLRDLWLRCCWQDGRSVRWRQRLERTRVSVLHPVQGGVQPVAGAESRPQPLVEGREGRVVGHDQNLQAEVELLKPLDDTVSDKSQPAKRKTQPGGGNLMECLWTGFTWDSQQSHDTMWLQPVRSFFLLLCANKWRYKHTRATREQRTEGFVQSDCSGLTCDSRFSRLYQVSQTQEYKNE